MKKILSTLLAVFTTALISNAQTVKTITQASGAKKYFILSEVTSETYEKEAIIWDKGPVEVKWCNVAVFETSTLSDAGVGTTFRFYTSGTGQIILYGIVTVDPDSGEYDKWTPIITSFEWDDSSVTHLDHILTEEDIATIKSSDYLVVQGLGLTLNKISLIP